MKNLNNTTEKKSVEFLKWYGYDEKQIAEYFSQDERMRIIKNSWFEREGYNDTWNDMKKQKRIFIIGLLVMLGLPMICLLIYSPIGFLTLVSIVGLYVGAHLLKHRMNTEGKFVSSFLIWMLALILLPILLLLIGMN